MLEKQELYHELWKVSSFALCPNYRTKAHLGLIFSIIQVALLFQIRHSPHWVFLQTGQCTG